MSFSNEDKVLGSKVTNEMSETVVLGFNFLGTQCPSTFALPILTSFDTTFNSFNLHSRKPRTISHLFLSFSDENMMLTQF